MIFNIFKKVIFLSLLIPVFSFAYLNQEEIANFGANLCHTHDGIYSADGTEVGTKQIGFYSNYDFNASLDQTGRACLNESRTLNTTTEEIEKGWVLDNGFGAKCKLDGEKGKCNGTLHSYEVKELCDYYNSKKFADPKAECDRRNIICEWGNPDPKNRNNPSKCIARHIPYELCQAADNLDDPDAKLDACNKAKVCRFLNADDQFLVLANWSIRATCVAKNKYNRQMACGGINSQPVDERKGLCSSYGCQWIEKDSPEAISLGITESTCRSTFYYSDPLEQGDSTSDTPAFDCSGKGYFWNQAEAKDANCEDIFYKKTDKYLKQDITIGCHYGLSCVYKPPEIMITVDKKKEVVPAKPEVIDTPNQDQPTTEPVSETAGITSNFPTLHLMPVDTRDTPNVTGPTSDKVPNSCGNLLDVSDLKRRIQEVIDQLKRRLDNSTIRESMTTIEAKIIRAEQLLVKLNELEITSQHAQYYDSQH